jgi:hypothetical protein
MNIDQQALAAIEIWWNGLEPYRQYGHLPPKGAVGGPLVVLERLKDTYILDIGAHLTPKGAQIKGASGPAIARILARYGEERHFTSEGGRTNRGLIDQITALLNALRNLGLDELRVEDRNQIIDELQLFLVTKAREYFNLERVKIVYDPSKTTRETIQGLLKDAENNGKAGPVAEYLVGAKLAIRYPEIEVENHAFSEADAAGDRPGDFLIGNTSFHISVSPNEGHYTKCLSNLQQGYLVYLIVPDDWVPAARLPLDQRASGQIAVESIVSFVSQNIDELSGFTQAERTAKLAELLETYNRRVEAVENDQSLMIEIPRNLQR